MNDEHPSKCTAGQHETDWCKYEAAKESIREHQKIMIQWRNFINDVINVSFEGADLTGADIQELAVTHGLLKPQQMKAPCAPHCICNEVGEFPTLCYRKTYQ